MGKRIVDDASLTKVADAIRNKCGTTDSILFPDGFESAIASIDTAGEGIIPNGTIYITENNKTFDVTTYANAEVNIQMEETEEVKLQSRSVTPNADGWVLEPDPGYTGLSKVTVHGDSDLKAENIKKDVNIFGITGTYEGSGSSEGSGENVVGPDIEVDDLSELHSWSKYIIGGTVTETKVDTLNISGDQTGLDSIYEPVDYADEYDISNGKIVLVNPTENVTFTSSTNAQILLGKYIQTYETPNQYATAASPSGKFYRIDSTADIEYDKATYPTTSRSLRVSPAYRLNYAGSEDQLVGIVVSEDSNAYPQNGVQDGYKYVYNGTLDVSECNHTSVAQATPSITVNTTTGVITATSTQSAGLVSAGTKTATKQISHSNLIPDNIKSGVSIFGVEGSYTGSDNTRPLVVKSGSTSTATFDTGLSEIVTVILERNTADSTGLIHMSYTPMTGILNYVGYASYSEYVKNVSVDCTSVPSEYCTINGGTVVWTQTATSTVFIEGAAHTWWAIGYE